MHKHHDECRHRHEHSDQCRHGQPTAVPKHGFCPVDGKELRHNNVAFCQVHRNWECSQHVTLGVHHDLEKNSKARAEEGS
jgi:hypothetical protein